MRRKSKTGVVYRPVEYILAIVLCFLILTLLWSLNSINVQMKQEDILASGSNYPEGSVAHIDAISQSDIKSEGDSNSLMVKAESKSYQESDSKLKQVSELENLNKNEIASCDVLSAKLDSLILNLDSKINDFKSQLTEDMEDSSQKRSRHDNRLKSLRTTYDHDRVRSYALLAAKMPDENYKLRSNSYSTKIDRIIASNRQIYDFMRSDFRNKLDVQHNQRVGNINEYLSAYQISHTDLANNSKLTCSNSLPEAVNFYVTGKTNLESALKNNLNTTPAPSRFVIDESKELNGLMKKVVSNFEKDINEIKSEFIYLDKDLQSSQIPWISRE